MATDTAEIENPRAYFEELGDLHDSMVEKMELDFEARQLALTVSDLNSNFLDLPEYQGSRPATILFSLASIARAEIDCITGVRVYSLEFNRIAPTKPWSVCLRLAPSGLLEFQCVGIQLIKH
jgi:hypothetical protein